MSPILTAIARSARSATVLLTFIGLPSVAAQAQRLTPPDTAVGCRWQPECSASGASLRMEEVSRSGSGSGTEVVVSPRVSGLPREVPLTFWMRQLEGPASWLATGYMLDSSGAVVCADSAQHAALATTAGTGWCPAPLDKFELTVGKAGQGEPFAYAVSTIDGRHSAFAVVIPRPVTATIAGCGTLDLQLLTRDGRAVRILGSGFPPSSVLRTESKRGRETHPNEVTTDSTGRFLAVVHGAGRGGEATYTVRTDRCEVVLPYRWGRAAR